ncbi:hypothetical protein TREMEDRAFT_67472 [Tremella mesenterica DSM 1558]|uniref:uncharacterized protein n=1 Tax=Tremella mesenterica (strain ATCC 24925 / CBS 8224 / DSM 1558 / NBRC 9311 / NRRL Y-6157 / RJB 2259-6 / UBC 559-6) TaxID=578456 RepID=UPI0003F49BC4|nr:uncharacterized protein TREMEDRAFT_67472 [Tremella mesenterica DSM 1558]EIW73642.1 hypothetical protein TREMEDRAFT_67472 [Tremella mesenterica DSM 1558]
MASPTRYYASTPKTSSRPSSRSTSPVKAADVRSQAIAKLKRAASTSRQPNGRRQGDSPSRNPDQVEFQYASIDPGPSRYADAEQQPRIEQPQSYEQQHQHHHQVEYDQHQHHHENSPIYNQPQQHHHGDVELLSPSPTMPAFTQLFPQHQYQMMQRSLSASSPFHLPTPVHVPYAMQLAQSYIPSLSPSAAAFPGSGRNTPSPLPTLGELRNLQRSNSAAARAQAMSKLTGGRDTPQESDDDQALVAGPSGLQRAGTVGAPRTFADIISRRQVEQTEPEPKREQEITSEEQPLEFGPRPRIHRSFTVSSTNMGEERRSAVGRRMVLRLANRQAAREKEEAEVRQLWEQRRAEPGQQATFNADVTPPEDDDEDDPVLERPSTARPNEDHLTVDASSREDPNTLQIDRPASRGTMRSADEAFEYEAHLRRSLSSRTARGAMGAVPEPQIHAQALPVISMQSESLEQLHTPDFPEVKESAPLFSPSIHTPIKGTTAQAAVGGAISPTGTDGTVPGQSPGGDSTPARDALNSMMFVMGRGSSGVPAAHRSGDNFPMEVGDNGSSDWGTPAKELHPPTFAESPQRSPLAPYASRQTSSGGTDELEAPSISPRHSGGSWVDLVGTSSQVPSDPNSQHKHNQSVSSKFRSAIRRKRSQSHSSSVSRSPPTSPKILTDGLNIVKTFSRRGSSSSMSPSTSTAPSASRNSPMLPAGHERSPSHQPSMSSLSATASTAAHELPDSANSALIQHQLSVDHLQSHRGFMPRADLSDHRINAKLSPFPGFAQLEENVRHGAGGMEAPKLLHLASDSAIPSQQRTQAEASIYNIPLSHPEDHKRGSADSASRRGWLAKAFGQVSPRNSGGVSRKSSNPDIHDRSPRSAESPLWNFESDPFAPPPPPPAVPARMGRKGSASPAVSTVPEGSEDGSRMTRFTAKVELPQSLQEEKESFKTHEEESRGLPPKGAEVLKRMDDLLALEADDPARPDILDDPPRKLLLSGQVLQVVNSNTAKDRYLFLFNDILVITKPLLSTSLVANLDMKFIVKHVVPLYSLQVSSFSDPPVGPERHAVVERFINHFSEDPIMACNYLIERSNPRVDTMALASLIFKTPELDKTQLGILLSKNESLRNHYIDRFHFTNIRLDEALRMLLLSIRLPSDMLSSEELLRCFSYRYHLSNRQNFTFSQELTYELVLSMMQLNDAIYSTFGFALPNHSITRDVFISAFRSKDRHSSIPETLLIEMYGSIRHSSLLNSLSKDQSSHLRQINMIPNRLPTKLSFNIWSDTIRIIIPQPDPNFKIKLYGEGIEFDPPLLDFSSSSEMTFRIKGISLGPKTLLFQRKGQNAMLYEGIGNGKTIMVERSFMKHTFQISFLGNQGSKRKYCFSVQDNSIREKWGGLLLKQIGMNRKSRNLKIENHREKIKQVAENVSLQVLKDALIPLETITPFLNSSQPRPSLPNHLSQSNQINQVIQSIQSNQPFQQNQSNISSQNADFIEKQSSQSISTMNDKKTRSGSISAAYSVHGGQAEKSLGPLKPSGTQIDEEVKNGLINCQTGKEMVLLCRQNSLLPGLLELLQRMEKKKKVGREKVIRNRNLLV